MNLASRISTIGSENELFAGPTSLALVARLPASRIACADALRVVAILSVVACHIGLRTHVRVLGHGVGLTWLGLWAVDCFFVLTGYLLSKPYLKAVLGISPFPSSRKFFARRFFRIYPLYFVAVVASVAASVATGRTPSVGDIAAHLTMSHGLFPLFVSGLNAPLWTMSVDAQFYLALPLVAFLASKVLTRFDQSSRVKFVWLGLLAIVAFGVFERLVALYLTQSHFGDEDFKFVVCRNVLGMSSDFAIGVAVAFYELGTPQNSSNPKMYLVMLGAALLLLGTLVPLATASRIGATQVFANSISDLVGGLSAGLLLFAVSHGPFDNFKRALGSKIVVGVAALSYGIYLFHDLYIAHIGLMFDNQLIDPIHAFVFTIGVMCLIVSTAYVAHVSVEKRFLRMRDQQR